jgi:CRISPR-associated protein Cas2
VDVLVAYDIDTREPSGQRRLSAVAKVCESYGQRIQYSLFECRLSETRLEHLIMELTDKIDQTVDSVCIYRFPGILADARQILGMRKASDLGGPWLL